ncbi:MAG: PilZ domain-containing protein [Magnetococcales bacterium]|nr:PilZ domain-containing protein [Magnetococcales bacterium]
MEQQLNVCNKDYPNRVAPPARIMENRRKERYDLRFPFRFEMENGEIFQGHTQDISTSGVMLNTNKKSPIGDEVGKVGLGQVVLYNETYKFKCRVVRLTNKGIALYYDDHGILGHAITMCIYNELAEKLKVPGGFSL